MSKEQEQARYCFLQCIASLLAHFYCVIHPSWHVCSGGGTPENPEWIGAASNLKSAQNPYIEVLTYPQWLIRRKNDKVAIVQITAEKDREHVFTLGNGYMIKASYRKITADFDLLLKWLVLLVDFHKPGIIIVDHAGIGQIAGLELSRARPFLKIIYDDTEHCLQQSQII